MLQAFFFQEKYLAPEFLKLVEYCKEADSDYDGVIELVKETNGEEYFLMFMYLSKTFHIIAF